MKRLLIGLTLLSSVASFGAAHQDKVACGISAKVGSETTKLRKLPRTITLGMDVVASGLSTDMLGLEKKVYEKEWTGYNYAMRGQAVSKEIQELVSISSIKKYTTNDVYINRSGIHNNRVKEFKIKLKKIKKDEIGTLLKALGYEGVELSSANKGIKFKNDTEFSHKSFTANVKFPKEKVSAIFTFSCKNSIQLHGKQFF